MVKSPQQNFPIHNWQQNYFQMISGQMPFPTAI